MTAPVVLVLMVGCDVGGENLPEDPGDPAGGGSRGTIAFQQTAVGEVAEPEDGEDAHS